MNQQNIDIVGRGWNFPPKLNSQGGIALTNQSDEIMQSIKVILETSRGERRMRPEFGSMLNECLFAPNNATTWGLIAYYVEQALTRWEPRIDIESIRVVSQEDEERKEPHVEFGPVQEEVQDAGENGSPQEFKKIEVPPKRDEGGILIDIIYREKATNDERNLVVPFYLMPAEE